MIEELKFILQINVNEKNENENVKCNILIILVSLIIYLKNNLILIILNENSPCTFYHSIMHIFIKKPQNFKLKNW